MECDPFVDDLRQGMGFGQPGLGDLDEGGGCTRVLVVDGCCYFEDEALGLEAGMLSRFAKRKRADQDFTGKSATTTASGFGLTRCALQFQQVDNINHIERNYTTMQEYQICHIHTHHENGKIEVITGKMRYSDRWTTETDILNFLKHVGIECTEEDLEDCMAHLYGAEPTTRKSFGVEGKGYPVFINDTQLVIATNQPIEKWTLVPYKEVETTIR